MEREYSRPVRIKVAVAFCLGLLALAILVVWPASRSASADGGGVVALGTHHSCALIGGTAQCWGQGTSGQLGNGTFLDSERPVDVVGVPRVESIASGDFHTCGLSDGGGVYCWGLNLLGQLGDGTLLDKASAAPVVGLERGVVQLVAEHLRSCALLEGGAVRCWGNNLYGSLGDGTFDVNRSEPVEVVGLPGPARSIDVGGHHTCAIVDSGAVYCWGLNLFGQLGSPADSECGPFACSTAPLPVEGLGGVSALAAGSHHTCALLEDSDVLCWGRNDAGQLGDGSLVDSPEPVRVAELDDAVSIASAYDHTCAMRSSGELWCWGENGFGQLGDGSTEDSMLARLVAGLTDVAEVGLGAVHTCAASGAGEVFCWGNNSAGQLGGGEEDSAVPLQVTGLREKSDRARPTDLRGPTATVPPDDPLELPDTGSGEAESRHSAALGLVLVLAALMMLAAGLGLRWGVDR